MSHSANRLIGTTTHHNPYIQPPPMYNTPKHPPMYGGPPYYPPPSYQQPYPTIPPPTHEWTRVDTHDAPKCSTTLWYPLYIRLHPDH
jgi:hypothetical protein